MYSSVKSIFPSFSSQFEGTVPYMYLDIKGLVTIGIGNLIDPVSLALELNFVHKSDGSPATDNDIIFDWRSVKLNQQVAKQGYKACDKLTKLKLTEDGIKSLVLSKLYEFEAWLVNHYFSDFDNFPADAQLGILSMAWAMGPGFPKLFPSFTKHCIANDWNSAANECYMNSTHNPGLIPRNKMNRKLFLSAAYVVVNSLNPENLYGLQSIGRAS